MTRDDLLEHVLLRREHGEKPAVFNADEIRLWPDGAHAALRAAGFLQRMPPAQAIECDGCERNCVKHVHVRTRPDGKSAVAFITCDEPEDYGRIPVDLARLDQWQASGSVQPATVAQALGLALPPAVEAAQPRHAQRDAAIRAKYAELARAGKRNYVKEIRRTVQGTDSLSERRIRDIAKGR